MIVFTNPQPVANEHQWINALLAEGVEILHIRKPSFSVGEMHLFVNDISPSYRERLVLHAHHEIGEHMGIHRKHFSMGTSQPALYKSTEAIWSTATHTIEEFNALDPVYAYAFLSPLFPSISKPGYVSSVNLLDANKYRTNFKTQLVGLGGISSDAIKQVYAAGFDEIALLGSIWQAANPLKEFKKCLKIAQSYLH